MKKLLSLTMAVVFALFLMSCEDSSTEPKDDPINEFDLVAALGDVYYTDYTNASGAGVNISISSLYTLLTDGDATNDPFIMDFRSPTFYNEAHIIGAINVTYDTLVALIEDGTVPMDRPIVNICYSGQGASQATALLNLLGYQAQNLLFAYCGVDTSISNADKWVGQTAVDEYANLETTANTTTTTYDFPTLNTGETTAEEIIKARASEAFSNWTISASDVWANPSNYFIINYWKASEYLNPGHIPGAYQFEPNSSLKSDEMLNLLPTDQTIVVYCYTGQTSSQVVTYLRLLGYDAKSLLYGVNGFAFHALDGIGHQYGAPIPGSFDAIIAP